MAKKVLIENPNSIYQDKPGVHYHYPKMYHSRMQQALGDWVLFYESKPALKYKAVGKVSEIVPDGLENHFRALIDQTTYLEFPNQVPFRYQGEVLNSALLNEAGKISGRAQSAVRPISDEDFIRIVELGLMDMEDSLPRFDGDEQPTPDEIHEEQVTFDYDRSHIEVTLTKKVRGKAFRKNVLSAYNNTCAFSGLSFINGGGRAEVQAAHIVPVSDGGNDSVRNGMALCGTAHWMFDRGFLSLDDDSTVLVSRHLNNVDDVNRLLRPDRKAILPEHLHKQPHEEYLAWHRTNVFKT